MQYDDKDDDFSEFHYPDWAIISDHFLLQMNALEAEGYTARDIVKGMSQALADAAMEL